LFSQSFAWYFSLANIALEGIGFVVNKLVIWQKDLTQKREHPPQAGQTDDDQAAKLEEMRIGVNTQMAQYAPDTKA
jgi:hypothetical protein